MLFFLFFIGKTEAQVHAGLTVYGNKITVTYVPKANYNSDPQNRWGTQVLTIRYPTGTSVAWSNLTNLSAFSFTEDPSTIPAVNGGDGYTYKVFTAADENTLLNLTPGSNVAVFSVEVAASSNVTFEVIGTSAWTKGNKGDATITNTKLGNIFSEVTFLGNTTLDASIPQAKVYSSAPNPTNSSPIPVSITFTEEITGFTANDLTVWNGTPTNLKSSDKINFTVDIIPYGPGLVTVVLPENRVLDAGGNGNVVTNAYTVEYSSAPNSCLATYLLEEQNDGFYQVSLISHTNWSGTDAFTATGQVTLKVGTSTSPIDYFTVTDLTSLVPDVYWELNSRYDAPTEDQAHDYISFGLATHGTQNITYVDGDTVPLFRFKNTGICSGDSIYLMAVAGDPFAWPNSLNANVGQQLSVSGYNEPDVPLCVEGLASCMAEVKFGFKAMLQGPYSASTDRMNDNLRAKDYIPTQEPYTGYRPLDGSSFEPFHQFDDGGGETVADPFVFEDYGDDAIVDWVLIELRSKYDPTKILSTRSALIQRDGDIVDTTGYDYLTFRKLREDSYYYAIRHRNHLGLMSATAIPLINTPVVALPQGHATITRDLTPDGAANSFDFSDPATALYGSNSAFILGLRCLMWAGNSNGDPYIMFQGGGVGEGLDIDNVFYNIITDSVNTNYSYNHVRDGYYPGDINLDGFVKYQGPANDVDPFIFFNIISRHPENTQKYINFYINEQLPEN